MQPGRHAGVPANRDVGIQPLRHSGTSAGDHTDTAGRSRLERGIQQERRISGALVFLLFGIPEYRSFGCPAWLRGATPLTSSSLSAGNRQLRQSLNRNRLPSFQCAGRFVSGAPSSRNTCAVEFATEDLPLRDPTAMQDRPAGGPVFRLSGSLLRFPVYRCSGRSARRLSFGAGAAAAGEVGGKQPSAQPCRGIHVGRA
jgi:hypothetical protein